MVGQDKGWVHRGSMWLKRLWKTWDHAFWEGTTPHLTACIDWWNVGTTGGDFVPRPQERALVALFAVAAGLDPLKRGGLAQAGCQASLPVIPPRGSSGLHFITAAQPSRSAHSEHRWSMASRTLASACLASDPTRVR